MKQDYKTFTPNIIRDEVCFERLVVEDIPQIMDLQEVTNLGFWSLKSYEEIISNHDYFCLTGKLNGSLKGFINSRQIISEYCVEILNMAVHPDLRNRGIAQKLLDCLVEHCKLNDVLYAFLEVRESNNAALQFYKKNGFTVTARRKNFYTNPSENALLMRLNF